MNTSSRPARQRPTHNPIRDLTLAMAIKIVLVLALYALLSRPVFRPASDAVATAAAVAGPSGVQ
jgi:hypothetical protein